ncbi:MAG: hypothetical protein ACOX83_12330 [Candidatus Spyradocola sp.]
MTTREALLAARERLSDVTPLPTDCGLLCGAACCKDSPDAAEVAGMLLFPEEASLYARQGAWMELLPSHLLFAGEPVPLLTCHLPCPRPMRPLACRIFPLVPFVKGEKLTLRMDVRARPLCPLYDSGISGLSPDFVAAVKDAMRVLWQDPVHREFLCLLTEHLKEYDFLSL